MYHRGRPLEVPQVERPASPVAKSILRSGPLILNPKEDEVKSQGFAASSPDPNKLYSHFAENSNDYSVFHNTMECLEFSKVRPGPARELLDSQLPSFEGGGEVLNKTLAPVSLESQVVRTESPVVVDMESATGPPGSGD